MALGTKRTRDPAFRRWPPASSSANHDHGIWVENLQKSLNAIPAEIDMDSRVERIALKLRHKLPQIFLEKSNRNRRLIERQLRRYIDRRAHMDMGSKLAC